MQIQSEAQALTMVSDVRNDPREREAAVRFLTEHPSPQAIQQLVRLLEDGDFGVRWESAVGLAQLGEVALPELLKALVDPQRVADPRLREGAYHVLHYNHSPEVLSLTRQLMLALKGAAADIATLEAASSVLAKVQARRQAADRAAAVMARAAENGS